MEFDVAGVHGEGRELMPDGIAVEGVRHDDRTGLDSFGSLACTTCHHAHLLSMPAVARGRVASASVVGCRGLSSCCPCCGLAVVGGNGTVCGMCLSGTHGNDTHSSCLGHGEEQGAGTKSTSYEYR